MNNRELAKAIIMSRSGVAKSADFVAAGIRAVDVVNMCIAGYLERVRHGYYSLAGEDIVSEEQLLATLVRRELCVLSLPFSTMDTVTSHHANGPLQCHVLYPEQNLRWMRLFCGLTMYRTICMNWVKPQGVFRVLICLFMTGKEPFVTASNTVPGWTTNCSPKPCMPMQTIQRRI